MRFLLDSSSIIAMARAGRLELLHRIVRKGWITEPVQAELLAKDDETTAAIRPAIASWISTLRRAEAPEAYVRLGLHDGEASLLEAAGVDDVVVTDEKDGRALAEALGLTSVGLLGLLLAAARDGIITKTEATESLDALERVGFWMSPHLRAEFRRALEKRM